MYLAKRARMGPLAAERYARLWGEASDIIVPAVRFAEQQHGGRDNGALDFIHTRYLNMEAA